MWQCCMAGYKELLSQELSFREMINFLPQNQFSDTFFLRRVVSSMVTGIGALLVRPLGTHWDVSAALWLLI